MWAKKHAIVARFCRRCHATRVINAPRRHAQRQGGVCERKVRNRFSEVRTAVVAGKENKLKLDVINDSSGNARSMLLKNVLWGFP